MSPIGYQRFRNRCIATGPGPRSDALTADVRRAFRRALRGIDGIKADEWTPRELRHSFVSLLSDRGVPLEEISRLVGHSGPAVTEEVYRKQIRPVIQTGAVAMDGIFGTQERRPWTRGSGSHSDRHADRNKKTT